MTRFALQFPKTGRPEYFHQPVEIIEDSAVESRAGRVLVFLFMLLLIASASIFRMDVAAYAEGSITVAGNRQAVQHRDGGTIAAIHVREGQRVRRGQILIELAAPELRANERTIAASVIGLQAERARLMAEGTGATDIDSASMFAALSPEDRILAGEAIRLQRAELHARRQSEASRRAILYQQVAQIDKRIGGIGGQLQATRRQSNLIRDELTGLRELAVRGFASINRIREKERTEAALSGEAASLTATAASAHEQIGEVRMQAISNERQTMTEVAERLSAIDEALGEAMPKWGALRRQVDDQRVRATASGQVVGLTIHTIGGVIVPGQKLMEIVPDAKPLVVEMNIAPADMDMLAVGQRTELRFPSIHDRSLPAYHGEIVRLSADSFLDERSGLRYFTGTVSIPAASVAELRQLRGNNGGLKSGLPVEIIVPLRKRTLLQYAMEPLLQGLRRSGSER